MNSIHLELSREEMESPEYRRFETDIDLPFWEEGIPAMIEYWKHTREEEEV